MKKDFMLIAVLVFITTAVYCISSVLSGKVFEPYCMAVIFSVLPVILILSECNEKSVPVMPTICFIINSIILYSIAKMMHEAEIEFYNSKIWIASDYVPVLPIVTWGWYIHIAITAVVALCCWKYSMKIRKKMGQ